MFATTHFSRRSDVFRTRVRPFLSNLRTTDRWILRLTVTFVLFGTSTAVGQTYVEPQLPPPVPDYVMPTQPDALPGPLPGPTPMPDMTGGLEVPPQVIESRWLASVDALWLERDVGRSTLLGYTAINPSASGPPAVPFDELRTDDVLFPLTTGLRVQLGYRLDDLRTVEASYFGLQQWSVGRTIMGDPAGDTVLLFSPWTQTDALIGGFNNTLSYRYQSRIDNVEINESTLLGRGYFGRSTSVLWGFRYFHLADSFNLSGSDLDTGDYENLDYSTQNNLFGLQVGLRSQQDWDRWQTSSEIKAGVYANAYTEHGSNLNSSGVLTGDPAGFIPFTESNKGTDAAGLFELSLTIRYALTPHLWLRGGYQAYWVTGLALASRQLGGANHGGTTFLDGPSLGLEAAW